MSLQLSKSTFLKGYQCTKALYLHKHYPQLKDQISTMQQAVFDRGTGVGILAQQLFPGGINASPDLPRNYSGAIQYTSKLVDKNTPVIYEAGFVFDEVACFVDILVRQNDGWHAFEVKSSTNLSNVYQLDAALQYHVIKNNGLDLKAIYIVLLNNGYVRRGDLDIRSLFSVHSVTQAAEKLQPEIREKIVEFKDMLSLPGIPQVDIGPHCTDPYSCDFMGHCWKHIPGESVFEVSGLTGPRKWQLYQDGILKMTDIPKSFPLSPSQRLQVDGARNGKSIWKKKEVAEMVNALKYPLYFLDFESFQPAVPLYDYTRPYQQVPFQYSLHVIEKEGAALQHFEFLAEAGPDPRMPFAESLIRDIGEKGDVIIYNKAFEKRILHEIARDFPGYRQELEEIVNRMVDLMEPFRKKLIYTPAMKGSYSIKNVLPALVPEYTYSGLEIGDGGSASIAFEGLFNQNDPRKIKTIRRQLLEYCSLDTLAMVKILEAMKSFASG